MKSSSHDPLNQITFKAKLANHVRKNQFLQKRASRPSPDLLCPTCGTRLVSRGGGKQHLNSYSCHTGLSSLGGFSTGKEDKFLATQQRLHRFMQGFHLVTDGLLHSLVPSAPKCPELCAPKCPSAPKPVSPSSRLSAHQLQPETQVSHLSLSVEVPELCCQSAMTQLITEEIVCFCFHNKFKKGFL